MRSPRRENCLPINWASRLADNSSPYTSTIVFLVRKGNPKGIKDWSDLIKPGIQVITPNPKTSGGARWNYLAAWGWALKQPGGSDATAKEFVKKLYKNVPVLDTGARGSTTTFVQRGLGDVLIAWENEAMLAVKELGADKLQIVVPTVSVLAEPPVAVVDKVVLRRGTREVAQAYLQYLYSKEGQEIVAKNYYRPRDQEVAAKYAAQYPKLNLVTIADFGGWSKVQPTHFGDGGVFDQIYAPGHWCTQPAAVVHGPGHERAFGTPAKGATFAGEKWASHAVGSGRRGYALATARSLPTGADR